MKCGCNCWEQLNFSHISVLKVKVFQRKAASPLMTLLFSNLYFSNSRLRDIYGKKKQNKKTIMMKNTEQHTETLVLKQLSYCARQNYCFRQVILVALRRVIKLFSPLLNRAENLIHSVHLHQIFPLFGGADIRFAADPIHYNKLPNRGLPDCHLF